MRASPPWRWLPWGGGSPTKNNNREIYAIYGARIITPLEIFDPGTIIVSGGVILWVGPSDNVSLPTSALKIEGTGLTVAPGFIDIHVHGAGGRLVASATSDDDIYHVARQLQVSGTTSYFATVGSLGGGTRRDLVSSVGRCRAFIAKNHDAHPAGAEMIGIHLEGPFLSPDKAGVSQAFSSRVDYALEADLASDLLEAGREYVRLTVVAPELSCAREVTRIYREHGVVVSLGHTNAAHDLAQEAIAVWGMSHATHTYNAMRALHHREPGVVAATLVSKTVVNEVIADGVHVHPTMIRLLLKAKPREQVVLVTDGSGLWGMPEGKHVLPGTSVEVHVKGGRCALGDGTIAGSVVPMNHQIRFLVSQCGVSEAHAIQLATLNPALEFGLHDRGLLSPGRIADLVMMDGFHVKAVFQRGIPRFFDGAML